MYSMIKVDIFEHLDLLNFIIFMFLASVTSPISSAINSRVCFDDIYPGKHHVFNRCCFNGGAALVTEDQCWTSTEPIHHIGSWCIHASPSTYLSFLPTRIFPSKLVILLHVLLPSSKHETFVKHLYNIGPTSSTLVQRCINVIHFCVFAGDTSLTPWNGQFSISHSFSSTSFCMSW